jgi:hypothetical protein
VKLYSRPGNDLTYRFPLIVEALAKLRSQSCIIGRDVPRPGCFRQSIDDLKFQIAKREKAETARAQARWRGWPCAR